MANHLSGARRAEMKEKRLRWLEDRPELLARLPGKDDDVDTKGAVALADAVVQMLDANLFSRNSERTDTKWSIRLLVSELRRE